MKTIEEQGGYAFACAAENGHQGGMTLRDWFAGLAVQTKTQFFTPEMAAEEAYKVADAMLKAREK